MTRDVVGLSFQSFHLYVILFVKLQVILQIWQKCSPLLKYENRNISAKKKELWLRGEMFFFLKGHCALMNHPIVKELHTNGAIWQNHYSDTSFKSKRSKVSFIIIFCRNTLLAIFKFSTQEQKGTHCDHILSGSELVTLIFGAHQWNSLKFPAGDHIPHGWEQPARVRVWPVALFHMSPPLLSCQSSEHLSNKAEKSQI